MKYPGFLLLLFLTSPVYAVELFKDDFERAQLGSNWTASDNSRAVIRNVPGSITSGGRFLRTGSGTVTVTSKSFDLTKFSSASVTFKWLRGFNSLGAGVSDAPEAGENLQFQYSPDGTNWSTLMTLNGGGTAGQSGNETLVIPTSALTRNFQFRFFQTAGDPASDYWHIDDVVLNADPLLSCFNDNFNRSSLNAEWVSSNQAGGFSPTIVDGRLKITQDRRRRQQQATSVSLQRLFPTNGNYITVEFDHFAWSPNPGNRVTDHNGGFVNIGADGIAIIFSDSTVTPQAGASGGSLGYAQWKRPRASSNVDGFAGGWLGIAIDEWGNFAAANEGRNGGKNREVRNSVSIRGSGSGRDGYRYITDSGSLNPGVDQRNTAVAGPGYRYRIVYDATVAGRFLVSVLRDTGSGFVSLIAPTNILSQAGQAALPANFLLSLTGSTGFFSNNHDIDNLQVCAQESRSINARVHHFEWNFSSNALTCSPETLTLRACDNAACSQLYTDPVTVNLSANNWLAGNTVTFSGGSTTLQLRRNTIGTETFSVTNSTPPRQAFQTDVCVRDGSAGNNCSINYASSGFLISNHNMVANQPVTNVQIRAVEAAAPNAERCLPLFQNTTKTLSLSSAYVSPNNGSKAVQVRGNQPGDSFRNINSGAYNINFDNNGQANISLNYADAGRIQLNANHQGSGVTAGLVMNGSGTIYSRPAGFCIRAEKLDGTASAACSSNFSACSRFVPAGDDFNLKVQAVAFDANTPANLCDNNGTPNFSSRVNLSPGLVAPSTGVPGALSTPSYTHTADPSGGNNGSQTVRTNQSEVGVFHFNVAAVSDYLGVSGFTIPAASTQAPVGRFYPSEFRVSLPAVTAACGNTFSYMGQNAITAQFTATAFNAKGAVTQNYKDDFAFATQVQLVAENNNDGVNRSGRLTNVSNLNSASWINGVASYIDSDVSFTRAASGPDGPYQNLRIGLQLSDSDAGLAGLNMNAATTGTCTGADCDALLLGNTDVRFGNLYLANAFGPETTSLLQRVEARYFDGNNFIVNRDDNACHTLSASNPPLVSTGALAATSRTVQQAITSGVGFIRYSAPGLGNSGRLAVEYQAPTWLTTEYGTNGNVSDHEENPKASVTFGQYRGNDRVMYWREVSN